MAVGDITSNEVGSGARFNDGKAPMDLIPPATFRYAFEPRIEEMTEPHKQDVVTVLWALDELYQGRHYNFRKSLQHLDHWYIESCRVFDYGRKKYAAWNWAKGMKWSVPVGCILRHTYAIIKGQDTDEESGWEHFGHIYCNLVMLDHFLDYYPEGNDLPDPAVVFRRPSIESISIPHDDRLDAAQWANNDDYEDYMNVRAGRPDCDGL